MQRSNLLSYKYGSTVVPGKIYYQKNAELRQFHANFITFVD